MRESLRKERAQLRAIESPQWREACSDLWKDSASCLLWIFSILSALFAINLSHHLSITHRVEDLKIEKKGFWICSKHRENVTMLSCFSCPVVPHRLKPCPVLSYCTIWLPRHQVTPSGRTQFAPFWLELPRLQLCPNLFVPEKREASSCPAWIMMHRLISLFSIKVGYYHWVT